MSKGLLSFLANLSLNNDLKKNSKLKIEGKEYEIKEKIGQGGFGSVYKAKDKKSNAFAIKQMNVDDENFKLAMSEIEFIKSINEEFKSHLPIIKVFGMDFKDKSLFYVMELATGSLRKLFDESKDAKTSYIFHYFYLSMLSALVFLESIDVVHRDIKSDNFVVIQNDKMPFKFSIKLIDFGTVKTLELNDSKLKTSSVIGTLVYMAPESHSGVIHKKSDVWSLGIILYELLYSSFPDFCANVDNLSKFIVNPDAQVKFPEKNFGEFEGENLVRITKDCLERDLFDRPLASDLWKKSMNSYQYTCDLIYNHKNGHAFHEKYVKTCGKYLKPNKGMNVPTTSSHVISPAKTRNCFICAKRLPYNHAYKRCDDCFNRKCLICYRQLSPGHEHRRCDNCFKTKCLVCFKTLPANYPYKRCKDCFNKR